MGKTYKDDNGGKPIKVKLSEKPKGNKGNFRNHETEIPEDDADLINFWDLENTEEEVQED